TPILALREVNGSPRVAVPASSATGITWVLGRSTKTFRVEATRRDAAGYVSVAGRPVANSRSRRFSTTLRLAPGCWQLKVRAGKTTVTEVVRAVPLPDRSTCDATALQTTAHDGLPAGLPWLSATTAHGSIYGSLFYRSPTPASFGMYLHGEVPDG